VVHPTQTFGSGVCSKWSPPTHTPFIRLAMHSSMQFFIEQLLRDIVANTVKKNRKFPRDRCKFMDEDYIHYHNFAPGSSIVLLD
jgi:hypothetical protein